MLNLQLELAVPFRQSPPPVHGRDTEERLAWSRKGSRILSQSQSKGDWHVESLEYVSAQRGEIHTCTGLSIRIIPLP